MQNYITKTVTSNFPVVQTITNTHFQSNYITVTKTEVSVHTTSLYSTLTQPHYRDRLVTVFKKQQQQVPVYYTVTKTQGQYQPIIQTVQAPCYSRIQNYKRAITNI